MGHPWPWVNRPQVPAVLGIGEEGRATRSLRRVFGVLRRGTSRGVSGGTRYAGGREETVRRTDCTVAARLLLDAQSLFPADGAPEEQGCSEYLRRELRRRMSPADVSRALALAWIGLVITMPLPPRSVRTPPASLLHSLYGWGPVSRFTQHSEAWGGRRCLRSAQASRSASRERSNRGRGTKVNDNECHNTAVLHLASSRLCGGRSRT